MARTGTIESLQVEDDEENFFCEPCVIAKQSRPTHPDEEWAEAQSRGWWIRPHGLVRRIRDAFARRCTLFSSISFSSRTTRPGSGRWSSCRASRKYRRQWRITCGALSGKLHGSYARYGVTTAASTSQRRMKNFVENRTESINHQVIGPRLATELSCWTWDAHHCQERAVDTQDARLTCCRQKQLQRRYTYWIALWIGSAIIAKHYSRPGSDTSRMLYIWNYSAATRI